MPASRPRSTPALYPGGLTRGQAVAWRNAIFVIFALPGLALASWLSRTPAIRDSLEASTAEMGLLILGASAGSILGLVASSHFIARWGARTIVTWCYCIAAVGLIVAGLGATIGPSYLVAFLGLALFGSTTGAGDVAMNVLGAANERVLGRNIMPIFHAFFSIGTMVGAALGALAENAGIPVAVHVGAIAVVVAIAALACMRFLQSEHIVGDNAEPVPADDHSKTWRGRLSIWRDPRTLLIGLIVLGMAFTEGSANDWLTLAMVDGYGVANEVGALIFGVFVTAMTVGRLLGVLLLDRFGRVPVLRASAVLAAVGLLIVIFGPNPWVAVVGVIMWGLGAALGFPVGMSAAADDPKTAAARVSAVATIGYLAFLVGPPLIGFLGQRFGLLNALLVVLVLAAISGAVSSAARNPAAAPIAEDDTPPDRLSGA